MPVHDYDPGSIVGRDDLVRKLIQRIFSNLPGDRGLYLEGPAKRGKSWCVCRLREMLNDPVAFQASVPAQTSIAVVLYTHTSSEKNGKPFDPLWLMAQLWCELRPHLPNLFWPTHVPSGISPVQAVYDQFVQDGRDAEVLSAIVKNELNSIGQPLYLVVLVDGLDEFSYLQRFEREFLASLGLSDRVLTVASRRSQARGIAWETYALRRIVPEEAYSLEPLSVAAAEEQLKRLLGGQASLVNRLMQEFRFYRWQNPGVNKLLIEYAIKNSAQAELVSAVDIRSCLLEMTKSGLYQQPIADQDLDWLISVVRKQSIDGSKAIAIHKLDGALALAAGRSVGNNERNKWLGRLKDRALVELRDSSLCRVHEEVAALCREKEPKA